jgi:hypothetical protein
VQTRLERISTRFRFHGDFICAEAYGSGNIHDTYAVTTSQSGKKVRYIVQRINDYVFKNPRQLMSNIQRVTRHLYEKLSSTGSGEASRVCLQLVPCVDGACFHVDKQGQYWRSFQFIEDSHTIDVIHSPELAYQVATAFGNFQKDLMDLPGERLFEPISDFHNTRAHFTNLKDAIASNPCSRVGNCRPEIDFALKHKDVATRVVDLIKSGQLPERITHNDTKINNVLLDDKTHRGICVIDLDTVMPGSILYDFGDLVRSSVSPTTEDETDLDRIVCRLGLFEGLSEGYLSVTADFLTQKECELLVFACRLVTFEAGIRFLGDYLCGDPYFRTAYDEHNLHRCRTQFRLFKEIQKNEPRMLAIVEKYLT